MKKEFLHYDQYTKMKQTETFPFLQQLNSGFFNMQRNIFILSNFARTFIDIFNSSMTALFLQFAALDLNNWPLSHQRSHNQPPSCWSHPWPPSFQNNHKSNWKKCSKPGQMEVSCIKKKNSNTWQISWVQEYCTR